MFAASLKNATPIKLRFERKKKHRLSRVGSRRILLLHSEIMPVKQNVYKHYKHHRYIYIYIRVHI